MARLIDASGVVVFEGEVEGGGSQPRVRMVITPATPGIILAGATLYTPTPGDSLGFSTYYSVPTIWDGTTPSLHVRPQGEADELFTSVGDLTSADSNFDSAGHLKNSSQGLANQVGLIPIYFADATPLIVMVDDGAGGDPGSSVGECVVVLDIIPA